MAPNESGAREPKPKGLARYFTLTPVWLVLPIVGAIVAATMEPIQPHDYWWHLVMGRLLDAGTFPDANYFLYTLPQQLPFIDQPWLSQWLMWIAYDAGGPAATILMRNALVLGALALLLATAQRRTGDARATGAIGLIGVLLAYPVLTVRTRMFAFLPFAITIWACFGVADGALKRRWLVVLVPAVVFWANVHGSFVLAIALVAAFGVGRALTTLVEERRVDWSDVAGWGAALVGVTLACAVSPLGFEVYGYVAHLTAGSSVAQSVTEWQPPDIGDLFGQLFALVVLASLVLLGVRRRALRLGEMFVFAGTFVLAAGAMRGMFWWSVLLPIIVGPQVAALLPDSDTAPPTKREAWVNGGVFALLVGAAIIVQPGIGRTQLGELAQSASARRSGPGAWVMKDVNAYAALQRVDDDHRERIFHDQAIGGMVEFMGTTAENPAPVAYVDQRMEFIPDEVWDTFFEVSSGAPGWEDELSKHRVDTLVLTPSAQWGLIQKALMSPAWEMVFVDQAHVVFYRASLDRPQHPAE